MMAMPTNQIKREEPETLAAVPSKAEPPPSPVPPPEVKMESGIPPLPLFKPHGASDGFNGEAPGYLHNTRLGPGRHSGETDPDRHLYRPTHHGSMKCSRCYHYFKVSNGFCANCGKSKPAGVW